MFGGPTRAQAATRATTGGSDRDAEEQRPGALQIPDWAALVSGVRDGDSGAMAELYGIFAKGIRYFLLRHLGPDDIDDKVHDCFVIVTQAIRKGDLREPERLMGYVRTVVKRQIALSIDIAIHKRRMRA
jgi:RNA polymerase sigma-70 factor (ECF subfamily)